MIVVITLLSTSVSNAQISNSKTIEVQIYGNCDMCKNNIENAGNIKKTSIVNWNKESGIATIEYDITKTTSDEVLKRIALAGYDSQKFLAPDDIYANLPACCQYDRELKTTNNKVDATKEMEMNHDMHSSMEIGKNVAPTESVNQIHEVYNNYIELKDAFVQSNNKATYTTANNLLQLLNNIKMGELNEQEHLVWMKVVDDLKQSAAKIATSKDLGIQRKHFIILSENLFKVLEKAEIEAPIYYQFCPMANDGKGATWLSNEELIKNPYFGNQMLSCGSTKTTLK